MKESCISANGREQLGWEHGERCGTLFLECVYRNSSMYSVVGDLIAYVLLLGATFYAIAFGFRLLMSCARVVFKVVIAFLVFRLLLSLGTVDRTSVSYSE
ncbi:uncharacterized protein LOC27206162 [Drosophila simulans]|uniref:GD10840 n=1 Tax=Drosophila simulans TaxID=7240 RepID=B4QC78_DROSI|nr:uncharacterized protein LOC27206162 [Drosophila simulans]EDX06709.1 GD10840 [Drosophila simulans]KMY93092.1 uncharacterized protein Dsimw501_GD10840 [Drosophila simulans]